MKKLLLFLMFISSVCFAQIAVVGTPISGHNPGSQNYAVSLGATPTVGNAVILFCSNPPGDDCGTAANGWTKVGEKNQPGGTIGSGLFYRFVLSGDNGTYLVNSGNSTGFVMLQVTGTDSVYPITTSTYANSLGTTPTASTTTPPVTPNVSSMLPLAFIAEDNVATQTTGVTSSGWTFTASTPGYYHPASMAYGPRTTGSTPVSASFSFTQAQSYGIAAWTVLLNPTGTSGLSPSTLSMTASPTFYTAAGQAVTMTATVAPSTATGTVTFTNVTTNTVLGTCTLSNGACTFTSTAIPQGTNAIQSSYPGNSSLGPSRSNTVAVTNAYPIAYVSTSRVTYVSGTPVDVQTYITPFAATGTLTLYDGATSIGSCTVSSFVGKGNLSYKGCLFPGLILSTGLHSLTSVYSGDGTYPAKTSAAFVNSVNPIATSPGSCSAMTLGLNGSLNGFVPAINDEYHQRVDNLPADPNSAAIVADLSVNYLHLDFSSGKYGYSGIPYYVVDSGVTPGLTFAPALNGNELYPGDSDILNTWPGSTNTMWLENHYMSPQTDPTVGTTQGDDHLNLLDKATCTDSETYHTQQLLGQTPALTASSTAIWDMTSRAVPQTRSVGITSTEAGGLSVFEGLIRRDEVLAGRVTHATRIQTDRMNCDHYRAGDCETGFTFPSTHTADSGGRGHSYFQHYGLRYRLKASFDISGYSVTNQVILKGWKEFGFIMTDIGSRGYVSGTPDPNWDADDLVNLQIATTNLEAVEEPIQYSPDRYPAGTAAQITNFTASSNSVPRGSCTNLNVTTTNASYAIIDNAGFLRGNSNTVPVCPTSTTTYKLIVTNQFLLNDDGFQDGSRDTASQTITVTNPVPLNPKLPFIWGR